MAIAALHEATANAIGSSCALYDPCSVVKELVDNALDANATTISVEVSSNAIDTIQVKDNGLGIPPEDRDLICKRNHTSKIQTLEELRNVGGTSLGFRGQALASTAEMSESLIITTRTSAEIAGCVLTFDRNGNLLSSSNVAHPTGTSVSVSNFLKYFPVRRQAMLKAPTNMALQIRKLLQGYAVCRPHIRFSFKVAGGGKLDSSWVYAPRPESSHTGAPSDTLSEKQHPLFDAISKIIGVDVTAQCMIKDYSLNGFQLYAMLPRIDADVSKFEKKGQYLSIDGRPLSTSKAVARDLFKAYGTYIDHIFNRPPRTKKVPDPFLYLSIICPNGAYDANVEPLKDDLLFENFELVMTCIQAFFTEIYGDIEEDTTDAEANPASKIIPSRQTGSQATPDRCVLLRSSRTPQAVVRSNSLIRPSSTPDSTSRGVNPWSLAKRDLSTVYRDPSSHLLTPSRSKDVADRHLLNSGPDASALLSTFAGWVPRVTREQSQQGTERAGPCDLDFPALATESSSNGAASDKINVHHPLAPGDYEATKAALAERFGDGISSINALLPSPLTIRNNKVQSVLDISTRTQQQLAPEQQLSFRPPPFPLEKALDFEHRKKAATGTLKEIIGRNSLTKNTKNNEQRPQDLSSLYSAFSSSIKRPIRADDTTFSEELQLMTPVQGPAAGLQINSSATDSINSQLTKQIRARRVSTRLPFESVTDTTVHLSLSSNGSVSDIETVSRHLSKVDSYIETGALRFSFDSSCSSSTAEHWRTVTLDLIKERYQCDTIDVSISSLVS